MQVRLNFSESLENNSLNNKINKCNILLWKLIITLNFLVIWGIFINILTVILYRNKKEVKNHRRVGVSLDIYESFEKIKEPEIIHLGLWLVREKGPKIRMKEITGLVKGS